MTKSLAQARAYFPTEVHFCMHLYGKIKIRMQIRHFYSGNSTEMSNLYLYFLFSHTCIATFRNYSKVYYTCKCGSGVCVA